VCNGILTDTPLAYVRRTLGKLIDAERGAAQPLAA